MHLNSVKKNTLTVYCVSNIVQTQQQQQQQQQKVVS